MSVKSSVISSFRGGVDSGLQEDDEAPPEYYDVAESLEFLETWGEKKKGYQDLGVFCAFVLLYIVMLTFQLQVGASYLIDSAFRQQIVLDPIATQSDFWNFLISADSGEADTGILSTLFNNQWYNGNIYTTAEQGFIFDYNKLVGGVLIVQTRGKITQDGCTSDQGASAYQEFYQTCYTQNTDTAAFNSTYDSTVSDSFVYDSARGGYVVFFGTAEGRDEVLQRARTLKQLRWTDKATRGLTIKFAFYNGNLGLFSFCVMEFNYGLAGMFLNNNHLRIQSINMEPYRSNIDFVRAFLEVLFLIVVAYQTTDFIHTSYVKFKSEDEDTGLQMGWSAFADLWTPVDLANIALFLTYIAFRIAVLEMIYGNPITVPTNEYEPILEQVALVQNSQLVVNFLNIFIALLRFFKYYQFQGKLKVLNKTFGFAYDDLYHYMIMFCVIFGGYAVMAHFLFGSSVTDYCSLGLSLQTCWQMVFGQFTYSEIEDVNESMAALFFITFMFLVFIVLVNMLLAILLEAYEEATHDEEGTAILTEIGKGVLKGINVLQRRGKDIDDDMIIRALRRLQKRKYARATAMEIGELVARSIRKKHPGAPVDRTELGDIVAGNPLLKYIEVEEDEEAAEDMALRQDFPRDLVDNVEAVFRESEYLWDRTKSRNEVRRLLQPSTKKIKSKDIEVIPVKKKK